MTTFIRSINAEFAKLFTTRMWWILALILFIYIAILAGGLAWLFGGIQSGAITPNAPLPQSTTTFRRRASLTSRVGILAERPAFGNPRLARGFEEGAVFEVGHRRDQQTRRRSVADMVDRLGIRR